MTNDHDDLAGPMQIPGVTAVEQVSASINPRDSLCAVDAVVVNFNAANDLGGCVESLLTEPVARILVIDNDSHDASDAVIEQLTSRDSRVEWHPTGRNLGFGSGANRGLAASTAPFVMLINPDATVVPGAVDALRSALLADAQLGVVGPEVTGLDAVRYPSARSFPNMIEAMAHGAFGFIAPKNRWSRRYRNPDRIDWVSGTAMLLRKTAVEAIGGFDESYFMYVEDVDLCWRLGEAGWRSGFVPGATVRHRIGGSSEQVPYRMIAAHHRSLWRFARSTTKGWERLALPVVAVGLVARMVVASVARRVRRKPPAAQ